MTEYKMKTNHKPPFTPTQGRYLAFIIAYIERYGLPPAESEIAEAIKVSPPSANQMMKMLESKGFIRRQPGVRRSIEVLLATDEIPKWKGRIPSPMVNQWVQVAPPESASREARAKKTTVYRFRITLRDTQPPIWRTIETKDVTIERFHELMQTAMGWTNSHLHQFHVDGERLTDPEFVSGEFEDFGAIGYEGKRLSDWISDSHTWRACYEYDFGDGWMHDIVLESQSDAEPGVTYPRCIDGDRACPPEDVGGAWGFVDYVKAITDPEDDQHEDLLEWGGSFDPAKFKISTTTNRMRKRLPR
jgi:hypothetical protein